MQPHQRDVTTLLAAAVQACHEMVVLSTFLYFVANDFSSPDFLKYNDLNLFQFQVPPDAIEPLFKQIVNQFVHDRSRPEVSMMLIYYLKCMCFPD